MKGSNPPISAPVPPNIRPKPTIQKQGVPIQKSIIFFMRILPVFLARVSPASHKAKPACMKKTMNAATSVQVTSAELYMNQNLFLTPQTTKAPGGLFRPAPLPSGLLRLWLHSPTARSSKNLFTAVNFGVLPVRRPAQDCIFGDFDGKSGVRNGGTPPPPARPAGGFCGADSSPRRRRRPKTSRWARRSRCR